MTNQQMRDKIRQNLEAGGLPDDIMDAAVEMQMSLIALQRRMELEFGVGIKTFAVILRASTKALGMAIDLVHSADRRDD